MIYLCAIAISAICFGLAVDRIYQLPGISLSATVIQGSEMVPQWIQFAGALLLLLLSVKPVWRTIKGVFPCEAQEGLRGKAECRIGMLFRLQCKRTIVLKKFPAAGQAEAVLRGRSVHKKNYMQENHRRL